MFDKPYDAYVFFLCLIVFTIMTAAFCYLIAEIVRLTIKCIRGGMLDEKIIKEHFKPKKAEWLNITNKIISIVITVLLLIGLIFSMYLHVSEDTYSNKFGMLKVVSSTSMEKKHKKNTYLDKNNLDNQISMFDLVVVRPAPDEYDLELYDIIVYEYDDIQVIHRIVRIEEPNSKHPDQRWFITQGDAVSSTDREPVTYDQIKAIYENEKIPFVGSFVFFMRSPGGWLCVLLMLFAIIVIPIVEKILSKAIEERLRLLGYFDVPPTDDTPNDSDINNDVIEEHIVEVPIAIEEPKRVNPDKPIIFTFGKHGKTSHSNGSLNNEYTEIVNNYTLTIVNGRRMFLSARDKKGQACLKLGVEDMIGTCKFTVPDNVTTTILCVAQYKTNISRVYINDTLYNIINSSAKGKYDRIIIDTTTVKTINVITDETAPRIMIGAVEFHFDNEKGEE